MNTEIETETLVILFLVTLVLAPLWFFALSSAEAESEVSLRQVEGGIAPTERVVPTPVEVNELVAGVITWIALFVLVALIYLAHQLVRRIGHAGEPVDVDEASLPTGFLTEDRRLVDYWPARATAAGLVGLFGASVATVGFAALFVLEALTAARTQLLGVYGGALFLSLGALVAVYTAWFLPSVRLVEERTPSKIARPDPEEDDR